MRPIDIPQVYYHLPTQATSPIVHYVPYGKVSNIQTVPLPLVSHDSHLVAVDVPSAPAVDIPSTPAVDVPSAPAIDVPSVPAVDVPSTPAVDVPPVPAVDVPSASAVDVPSVPEATEVFDDLSKRTQDFPPVSSSAVD